MSPTMFTRPFDTLLRAIDTCHDVAPVLRQQLPPGCRLEGALERLVAALGEFDTACGGPPHAAVREDGAASPD